MSNLESHVHPTIHNTNCSSHLGPTCARVRLLQTSAGHRVVAVVFGRTMILGTPVHRHSKAATRDSAAKL